jgi:hypothetical protein
MANLRLGEGKILKQNIRFIILLLTVSFLAALVVRFFSSLKVFVLSGTLSILANLCVSSIYLFKNRDQFVKNRDQGGKSSGNYIYVVFGILTLAFPLAIFYVFFVCLLMFPELYKMLGP